jgi:NodT family efflux transporter outer membrane factor (OMF) lipoprotein
MRNVTDRSKLFRALLTSVFFLTGCAMVGPDYIRPPVKVSQNWLEADDQRVKPEPSESRNWWQVFNDPILDSLIERAYRDNLSLRVAGVRVLEARAQLGIAIGELYPQTQQAFGSLQYYQLSERSPQAAFQQPATGSRQQSTSVNLPKYWQSEIGLTASWELDFWGKFRRAIESADASLMATIADYDAALVSLTGDVASSYILIRTLEKRVDIAHQNVETQKENLRITEVRLSYGNTSQLDVEQAKTSLNNTLASIPALETQLRQAKNSLSVLLGLPPGHVEDILKGTSEIPVSPPQVVVGIPNDLLRRRPDIRSVEYQAAAQCAQIGIVKSELYPAFSLSGTFGFLSSDVGTFKLSDMFRWKSRTLQAGPSFQWNIFNYGRITNNVRVQDARFEQLLITYQNTVLKAQQEVEDSLIAFLRAQEQADFLAQATEAAKNSLNLAVLQYREGTKDFTTVLVAQQALLNEQDSLVTTLGNISSNLVGVYKALGGGWEIREGKDWVPPETREEMAKRTNWGKLLAPAVYNPADFEKPGSLIRFPDW